jgi:hypothetical protein
MVPFLSRLFQQRGGKTAGKHISCSLPTSTNYIAHSGLVLIGRHGTQGVALGYSITALRV